MNMLRIAFATPEYVTEKHFDGGLSNYIHRVARLLVQQGHEVHVLTLSEIDQAEFCHEGVQVHRIFLGTKHHRLNRLTCYRMGNTLKWLEFSTQVYGKLKHLHQRSPIDLLQFPNWSYCGLVSSLLLPIPRVLRISSYRPIWNQMGNTVRNLDSQLVEWFEFLQLRLSPYLYAPSYTLQRILAQHAHIHHVKVIRTPFFLETQDWDNTIYRQYLMGKKYLLFFGRFQLHKGFHVLVQALPQVLRQHSDCQVAFVGQDMGSTLAASMKDYAKTYCCDFLDRLTFIPQLSHHQLYPIIAKAYLVALPSLIDNLPNACLEAMALGKPIVGTIGASFEELLSDGETGFLVPPNQASALANKISEAWTHPHLDKIGQAAQQQMAEFAPERTVEAVLQFYQEVLYRWKNKTVI